MLETKPKKIRMLGVSLLALSGILVFLWFIWLEPLKNINSQSWWEYHSNRARWEESQKSVSRMGIDSDGIIEVGQWGDEKWAARIIKQIKSGRDTQDDEATLMSALAKITNHQLEPNAETWLAWWKTNQDKTQVEWIREGFAGQGLILQNPLTTNNIIDLLKIANLTNSPEYKKIFYFRGSLRWNAFRWLRDSEVDKWELFQIWNSEGKTMSQDDRDRMIAAIVDYAEWNGEHWNDPDKLSFNHDAYHWYEPFYVKKLFQCAIYCSIVLTALTGIYLIRRQPPR